MQNLDFVLLSTACQHCISFTEKYRQILEQRNFRFIVLDFNDLQMTSTRDLLWALQIDRLPTVRWSGMVFSGSEAFRCAATMECGPDLVRHSTLHNLHLQAVLSKEGSSVAVTGI
jgi:hypothetical protein